MKRQILIILSIFLVQLSFAQQRITSFSYLEGDQSSSPSNFLEFNDLIFFEASTESYGRELWITKGNENDAVLLMDIYPGENSGVFSSFKESSIILNNTLYFIAQDGSSKGEIWKTDGTTEGTEKVTNFLNNNIKELTLVGDDFYFLIQEGELLQVWISDGSDSGTKLVLGDIAIWNSPSYQGKCNNNFIFTFEPLGSNNSRVWRSDGTLAGTFPITEEIDGNGAGPGGTSALTQYIELDNELYFVSRYNLHKTDGSLENTKLVHNLNSVSEGLIEYADVIEINGKLYFSFFDIDNKRLFIWESDGTESGTSLIFDEYSSNYFFPSNLISIDNKLILCGPNQTGGTSLIKLNPSDYSTSHILELQETAEAPFIFSETYHLCKMEYISDNKIFISAPFENYESKAWVSDLTTANTTNITSLNKVSDIFLNNEAFYFAKDSVGIGSELWKSDGTEDNTILIDNINQTSYSINYGYITNLIELNSNLIFNANNGSIGDELWMYSAGDTSLLRDIGEGPRGSHPMCFTKYNNEIYFIANDYVHDIELWKTDGTQEGTQMVYDINTGTRFSNYSFIETFNEYLFFVAKKEDHYHLCKTNGSEVQFIKDLGENDYGVAYYLKELASSGDYLYFITEAAGDDLWISDGTEVGTYKLKDFHGCEKLTDVNGKLFFTAMESDHREMEIWSSDGTDLGTKRVKDIGTGYSSSPNELINFNNILYFTAYTEENGRELWQSNGTEEGTLQVTDINSESTSSIINANFSILNNEMYFCANDGISGLELWKTDGSESGTAIFKDINAGIESSFPSEIVTIQDLIYFQAYDNVNGAELWKSNGSEEETEQVADIFPGIQSSAPKSMMAISEDVYFIAKSSKNGEQIWKMPYDSVQISSIINQEVTFSVYPNPSSDYIRFNAEGSIEKFYIFNTNGQVVFKGNVINNSINISNLKAGLYILKCNLNGKEVVRKIIKR